MKKAFRRLAVILFTVCIIFAFSSCDATGLLDQIKDLDGLDGIKDLLGNGSLTETCEHEDADDDGKCDKCMTVHTHVMVETAAKAATCTEEGNVAYFTCSECNKVYLDAEGKNKGIYTGKSDEFIIVEADYSDNSIIGQRKKVKITKAYNWALHGEIL